MQQSNNKRKHNVPTLIDIPLFKQISKDPSGNAQRSLVLLLNHHISNILRGGHTAYLCSTDKLHDTGASPSQQIITEGYSPLTSLIIHPCNFFLHQCFLGLTTLSSNYTCICSLCSLHSQWRESGPSRKQLIPSQHNCLKPLG